MDLKSLLQIILITFAWQYSHGMPFLSQMEMMMPTHREKIEFTKSLVNSSRVFASQILNDLAQGKGTSKNIVFSPYSISSLLAILRLAAGGNTRREIENASLFRGLDLERVDEQFRTLTESISKFESLSVASQVAVDFDAVYMIDIDFMEAARDYHFTQLQFYDFQNEPEICREQINHWVANETKGQIPQFLTPGDVTRNTKMLLVNALQLNAVWRDPFMTSETRSGSFDLEDGSVVQVPMMHQLSTYRHLVAKEGRRTPDIIEIPFKHQRSASPRFCKNNLVILIPNQFISLKEIQQEFAKNIELWRRFAENNLVSLSLPKFKINYKIDLERSLRKQGISEAFEEGLANFSSMMDLPVSLSKSLHEATISFEETGVSAAAASSSAINIRNVPLARKMRINRPFLFFIEDCRTGALLFFGKINDPR